MREHAIEYDGSFYRAIGDFMAEKYLDWGFTRGTKQEVDFLIAQLGLTQGARVLDIGCGVGRHSLELARRGLRMTGIDISPGMIDVARRTAEQEKLPATFVVTDARKLDYPQQFDAAICLCEGAFGLAGSIDNHMEVLKRIHRALVSGGRFLLTAIHALSAVQNPHGDQRRFDPYTCTATERITITNPAGQQRQEQIWTTAFTFPQLELMMQIAGFVVEAGYGCEAGSFAAKPLAAQDIEIMIIGSKP
jgi:ubiquinone/menaquinone biosynthesis C-methylase UbiE